MPTKEEMKKALALVNGDDEGSAQNDTAVAASGFMKSLDDMKGFATKLFSKAGLFTEDERTGFADPKDSKGAKGKKEIDTHEAAKPTSEEEADAESDEDDGDSMTSRSPSGPGGADGDKNPTKKARRTGLPDETFSIKSAGAAESDDADVQKSAEELMNELIENDGFAEVVEASPALEHLTNTFIKGISMVLAENTRIRKGLKRQNELLKSQNTIIKGMLSGDLEKALSEDGDDDGADNVRKSGSQFSNGRVADPGVLALIDEKEVDMHGGKRIGKSRQYTPEYVADFGDKLCKGVEMGIIDAETLKHLDSKGPDFFFKSLDSTTLRRIGIQPLTS